MILDIIGGDYLARNMECLARHGRLVQIGLQGGTRAEINLSLLMQRRATLTGSTLRPRSVTEKGAIARELESHVWPLLAAGTVRRVQQRLSARERRRRAPRPRERRGHRQGRADDVGAVLISVSLDRTAAHRIARLTRVLCFRPSIVPRSPMGSR